MTKNRILGFVGAVLVLIGVFLPIFSFTMGGSFGDNLGLNQKSNILSSTDFYGIFVLILAITTMVLVLIKFYIGLFFTGIGALSTEIYVLSKVISETKNIGALQSLQQELLSGFNSLGTTPKVIQSVNVEWLAWILMIGGALMITATAVINEINRKKETR